MKTIPYDIALASALGAVVGLTIAIAIGWSLVLLPFLGAVAGFLLYRPTDVVSTTVRLRREIYEGLFRVRDACLGWWEKAWTTLGQITFVVLGDMIVFVSLLPVAILIEQSCKWFAPETTVPPGVSILCSIGMLLIGVIAFLLVQVYVDLPAKWFMPVCRYLLAPSLGIRPLRQPGGAQEKTSEPKTRKQILLLCLWLPLFVQLFALTSILHVLDWIFSIVLVCATTRRLASMTGAAIGCGAGAVAAALGVTPVPVVLAVGGGAGWCAGPLLYRVWEHIDSLPVPATR